MRWCSAWEKVEKRLGPREIVHAALLTPGWKIIQPWCEWKIMNSQHFLSAFRREAPASSSGSEASRCLNSLLNSRRESGWQWREIKITEFVSLSTLGRKPMTTSRISLLPHTKCCEFCFFFASFCCFYIHISWQIPCFVVFFFRLVLWVDGEGSKITRHQRWKVMKKRARESESAGVEELLNQLLKIKLLRHQWTYKRNYNHQTIVLFHFNFRDEERQSVDLRRRMHKTTGESPYDGMDKKNLTSHQRLSAENITSKTF